MNKLLLLSGNDLPFVGAKVNIHQPKIKEIAFLGEDTFYLGANLLCFSKDNLEEQDKINLANQSNFDILMSIMNNKTDNTIGASKVAAQLVLSLIFPDCQFLKIPNVLVINKQTEEGKQQYLINNDNFEQFKNIIKEMFCLGSIKGQDYNPANKLAEQIANKLKQRHKKLNQKGGNRSIDILSRYVSILTLGNHHTITELMEYTVYQLFNEFRRFERKYSYDAWYQAKLAGAEGLQDVDSWLVDEEDIALQMKPNSNKIEF